MNIRNAIRAALLTAALIPTTITAHAQPEYHATAGGACAFAFNKEPYLLHNAVVVGGVVECNPAPLQFYIELRLWHRSATNNPTPQGETAVSTHIPNPRLNVAAMALDCIPGVWQGRILMRATWETGTDEGRKETLPTFIQC